MLFKFIDVHYFHISLFEIQKLRNLHRLMPKLKTRHLRQQLKH